MRVMPASSAAWMVAMERDSSGLPSIDIGMPPSPMALTLVSPIWRRCIGLSCDGAGQSVLAGGQGAERRCCVLLGEAGGAQDVEHADEIVELDAPVDGDTAPPVLQVGDGGRYRQAAGLLHAQGWGGVHRYSSLAG